MSILQGLAGGALAGFGQGMMNIGEEKRERRGMALRDMYLQRQESRLFERQKEMAGIEQGYKSDLQAQAERHDATVRRADRTSRENIAEADLESRERVAGEQLEAQKTHWGILEQQAIRRNNMEEKRLNILREQAARDKEIFGLQKEESLIRLSMAYIEQDALKKQADAMAARGGISIKDYKEANDFLTARIKNYLGIEEFGPEHQRIVDLGLRYFEKNNKLPYTHSVTAEDIVADIQNGDVNIGDEDWQAKLLETYTIIGFIVPTEDDGWQKLLGSEAVRYELRYGDQAQQAATERMMKVNTDPPLTPEQERKDLVNRVRWSNTPEYQQYGGTVPMPTFKRRGVLNPGRR